jgi:hypothetical protein
MFPIFSIPTMPFKANGGKANGGKANGFTSKGGRGFIMILRVIRT